MHICINNSSLNCNYYCPIPPEVQFAPLLLGKKCWWVVTLRPKKFSGQFSKKRTFFLAFFRPYFELLLKWNVFQFDFFMIFCVILSAHDIYSPISTSKNEKKEVKAAPENLKLTYLRFKIVWVTQTLTHESFNCPLVESIYEGVTALMYWSNYLCRILGCKRQNIVSNILSVALSCCLSYCSHFHFTPILLYLN